MASPTLAVGSLFVSVPSGTTTELSGAAIFSDHVEAANRPPVSKNATLVKKGPVGPDLSALMAAICPAVMATRASPL
jgi:hypothetical protein